MKCITIENIKGFMASLLMKEDFDKYDLCEAEIVTYNRFTIDGHVQKRFYSEQDYEDMGSPQWSKWGKVRGLCYEMIKGSRTPVKFKIVLKLNDKETERLVEEQGLGYSIGDIGGLYLNISYENGLLNCITGTSLNVFTMDKGLERAWDERTEKAMGNY